MLLPVQQCTRAKTSHMMHLTMNMPMAVCFHSVDISAIADTADGLTAVSIMAVHYDCMFWQQRHGTCYPMITVKHTAVATEKKRKVCAARRFNRAVRHG